jgi:hypothetical protein
VTGRTGSDGRRVLLSKLRRRCDAWFAFLEEKGHVQPELTTIGRVGIEKAFKRGSVAGLQMLVRDIEEWKLSLSHDDLAEWERRSAEE